MESQFDLRTYLAILRRRYWWLIIPALLVLVASVGFAYFLPPTYEASATILVESQQIPTELVSPTVTANANERIHVIEQKLMTRDNLLQIADKFALFRGPDATRSPTTIADKMRDAISIEPIDLAATSPTTGVIGFKVKFKYGDAGTTARVTNELVSSILSQNVESRLSRASETSNFFAQQKTDFEGRLKALEDQIAAFRQQNEAAIPETLDARRQQLTQINQQIATINQKVAVMSMPGMADTSVIGGPSVKQLQYDLQIKQLQLKQDQDSRDRQDALVQKGLAPANSIKDFDSRLTIDQLGIDSLQAQIADAGGAVGTGDQMKLLTDQRDDLQKQAAGLAESIQQTPLVQVQLNGLLRDYDNLQAEYKLAQAKLEDAQTGERLEQDRQAERFEVIEQATVPDLPASPDRPKIMLAGAAGGLAAGAALIVLRQMLDNSIYTAADLERALQLRPIATIPYVITRGEKRRKLLARIGLVLLAVALVIAALVVVDIYYLPLDLVAEKLFDRVRDWLASRGLVQ